MIYTAILLTIAAVAVFARRAVQKRRERLEVELYDAFVMDMAQYCHCEYDCPCESVLCGGLCEEKQLSHDDDYPDEYEYRDH